MTTNGKSRKASIFALAVISMAVATTAKAATLVDFANGYPVSANTDFSSELNSLLTTAQIADINSSVVTGIGPSLTNNGITFTGNTGAPWMYNYGATTLDDTVMLNGNPWTATISGLSLVAGKEYDLYAMVVNIYGGTGSFTQGVRILTHSHTTN